MLSKDCKTCDCGNNPRFLAKPLLEIVEWAKSYKIEHNLKNLKIAADSSVPLSTVNRFFQYEDGDVVDFKYDTVHRIIMGMIASQPENNMPCPKMCNNDNTELLQLLEQKNHNLENEIGKLKLQEEKFEATKAEIIARYEADKKEHKEEAEKQISYFKDRGEKLRFWLIITAALLVLVLLGVVTFLTYDVTHPELGWLE